MAEPEWSDFKIILALGRGGSVAGAARILGVDSSTVSRRLAAAEEALGSVLIVRGGRDFCLTAEGRTAFAAAENMEATISSAMNTIRAAKTEREGLVRISCVPGLAEFFIPFQDRVEQLHPKLHFEITAAFQPADLARGEADIALRIGEPKAPDLIGKKSFEVGLRLYTSKTYAAQHGLPRNLEDLQNHRIVHYVKVYSHIPHFNWIEKYFRPDTSILRTEGTDKAFNLIRSGGGIGIVDCYRAEQSSDVIAVLPEHVVQAPGWIVYHESQRNTVRIKEAVNMLAEFLKENQAKLSGRQSL